MILTDSLLHKLVYAPVLPGGIAYSVLFSTSRMLFRLGLLHQNTKVHYLELDEAVLVLTPLAGSSSIRAATNGRMKTHDLRRPFKLGARQLYVMELPEPSRLRSFYNKKVRNPTNLPKVVLLSGLPPLTHRTTPTEFVDWSRDLPGKAEKDKHLYTAREIATQFGQDNTPVRFLNITKDRQELESLLGAQIGPIVNSSEKTTTFAPALDLPFGDETLAADLTKRHA